MKNSIIEATLGLLLFDYPETRDATQKTNVPATLPTIDMEAGSFPRLIRKWKEIWELGEGQGEAALYQGICDGGTNGWIVMRHRTHTKESYAQGKKNPASSFRIPLVSDFGRYEWNHLRNGREHALVKLMSLGETLGESKGGTRKW